jgi:hypothetical protein
VVQRTRCACTFPTFALEARASEGFVPAHSRAARHRLSCRSTVELRLTLVSSSPLLVSAFAHASLDVHRILGPLLAALRSNLYHSRTPTQPSIERPSGPRPTRSSVPQRPKPTFKPSSTGSRPPARSHDRRPSPRPRRSLRRVERRWRRRGRRRWRTRGV